MKFHSLRPRQNVPLGVQVNVIAKGGFFSWRVNFGYVYPALCSAWLTILSPSLLFCIQISLIAIYQIRNSLLLSEWSLKKVRILLRRKNIYFFALDFVSHTEIAMLGVNWNCSPIKFSKAYIKVKGEMHIEWKFFVYKWLSALWEHFK